MDIQSTHLSSQDKSATVIRPVSVISTGFGQVHPEHIFNTWKPPPWWILSSKALFKSLAIVCTLKELMPDLVIVTSHDHQAKQLTDW